MNFNERVLGLQPYVPGKPIEEVSRELGIVDAIKLASNENPRGPSPAVRQVIENSIDHLSRYPDGSAFELKQRLASKLAVEESRITIGNGSNDVLELAGRVALSPGTEGIVDERCFVVYPLAIAAAHGKQIAVPSKDWGHDLDAMFDAITDRTRIIYIANPNNPTGTYISDADFERFMDAVPPSVWVVLDEAYFEYAKADFPIPDGVKLVHRYPNLIVTRTFSKVYGLAALRIGYAVSSATFADYMNRLRHPFNANSIALAAAAQAISDETYAAESVALNKSGMSALTTAFDALNIEYIPSAGNFVSFQIDAAAERYQSLLRRGVVVRPIANYKMPDHLRVTVGLPDENEAFIGALKGVL